MAENRLDIIVGAKDDQFRQSMRRLSQEAKAAGDSAAAALTAAGKTSETAFDGAGEAAREMGRQTELALEAAQKEAQDLSATLAKTFSGKESDRLKSALGELEGSLREVGSDGQAALARVEKALNEVKAAAQEAADASDEIADSLSLANAAEGASRLAGALGKLKGSLDTVSGQSRNVDIALRKAFTNPADVQKYTAVIEDLAAKFEGLDVENTVQGIRLLERSGVASEKNIRLLSNAAQALGKDFEGLADPFGEFMAGVGKGADLGAFEELRVLLGLGADKMRELGAVVKDGKILGDTPEQIRLANEAMIRYLETNERFQGVSERSQDNIAKLNTEIGKFTTEVGKGANVIKNEMAGALLEYAEGLNSLSPGTKAAIGGAAELAVGVSSAGAKVLEIAAYASLAAPALGGAFTKALGLARTGATAAAGAIAGVGAGALAMGAGIAVAVGGLVLIAKSAYDARQATKDLEAAELSLLDTQTRAAEKTKEFTRFREASVKAIRAETDAIKEQGRQRVAITAAIQQKEDAANKARSQGDETWAKQLEKEAGLLRGVRSEYDQSTAAQVAAQERVKKAEADRFAATSAAFKTFKADVSKGLYDTAEAQLRELNSLIGNLKGDELQEARQARKGILDGMLADEVDTLKKIAQEQDLSAREVKARLSQLLSQYEATGDKRKAFEKDGAEFAKALDQERYDRLRALQQSDLDLKRSGLELQKSAAEASGGEVDALQRKLDAGEDVVKQLERELAGRAENAKRLLEEEATIERIAIKRAANDARANEPNKDNRLEISKQEAEQQRQLDQKLAQDKAAIDRQLAKDSEAVTKKRADYETAQAKKRHELEQKRADLTLQTYDQERQAAEDLYQKKRKQLEEQAAMGANVAAQLKKLDDDRAKALKKEIEDRLALEIDAINKRVTAENAAGGLTQAEKDLNIQKAQLEIQKAKTQATKDTETVVNANLDLLKQETAELVKQRDLIIAANKEKGKGRKDGFDSTIQGGAQSVEDAFSGNSSGWGVGRRDRDAQAAGDGPTVEELDKEIARRRAQAANAEALRRRTEGDTTKAPQWGDGAAPPGRAPAPDAPPAVASADLAPLVAATNQQTQLLTQLLAAQTRANNNSVQTIGKHVSNPYLS